MTENKIKIRNQNIMVEDREKMTVTGVEQVESFNDNTIILTTVKGGMTIKGEGLNIAKLNLDDGSVKIEGKINGVNYMNKEGTPKNIMGKIFK
ncbi:sporulation protein YabP [Tissierella praeacuta]|uniref:Sporulation protein YabP n=1 Tax=Tissierella praeacuta DSM 18095 TaxID=1123404 RepID=A0A1M4UNS3_9FIRM|nr:sporulation protein YabP [Tissierella praeacuta]MBU5257281.1 sporulation protein YabP [Tissierella praeacuta]TCU68894.1 sporulation protein YabP [Tissierella praeacuta]SHE58305.1 sporulation protein YabP [Tissierella praeacuta DSM 18095]SUP03498.1 sporulation protein YabP [Tissierella praeacuta]